MWRNFKHPGSCHECRKRRLKCDEAKPYCFKCQKNGRSCSGYTDWSQLAVRDMTASTINRFRSPQKSPKCEQALDDSSSNASSPMPCYPGRRVKARQARLYIAGRSESIALQTNPCPPIEEQAMSYLCSEFIEQLSLALDPGYSHFLRLVLQLERIDSCLSVCLTAAALAAFSTRPNAKAAENKAHQAYALALSEVNSAVQLSNAAENDQLLASVMVLALYETFCSDQLVGFYNHVFGAASMIKARKSKADPNGLPAQLYLVVRYELCRASLLGFANPEDMDLGLWIRWRDDIGCAIYVPKPTTDVGNADDDTNLDHHVRALMDFSVAENPLQAIINQSGFPRDVKSATYVVDTALSYFKVIIDKFTEMETMAFVTQGSRPLRLPRPTQRDFIFPDAYPQSPIYIYKNMHHAVFHLCICLGRVSCLTHMIAFASRVEFASGILETPDYRAMVARGQDDLETIVSSVPFLCGWTAEGIHIFPDDVKGSNKHPQTHQTCFATSFVAWALVGSAANPLATEEQKAYLMHMTRYIAVVRRMRQAEALLDVTAQATTRSSLSRWHQTAPPGDSRRIPASWMGEGTSLEGQIYNRNTSRDSLGYEALPGNGH